MGKHFPERGRSRDEVLAALSDARSSDLASDGHAFAFVYDVGGSVRDLARKAYAACMGINGLDPTAFPSARTIERGVSAACLELLHAPDGAVGTATAGGTESVMLAVKTARDFHPDIENPAILLPETAHACFHKAAHYLGLDVVRVDVDPVTFRADVEDARSKMTGDVVLVVGSAPSYSHGVVDPIEELAALAREYGKLMHVDACVGGCVLPFMADAPPFDFRVDGVTSISLDLHKYGFAPKGVSMLLQRNAALRDAQYYACAQWSGYAIVNSTTLGSKSAAAMGAAWTLIHHLGREGYGERVAAMWDATGRLVEAIDGLEDLRMVGRPDMNMLAFTTEKGDVFELSDRLASRGWHVQPTYALGRSPAHIHLSVDPGNAGNVERFIADLAGALDQLPPTEPPPAPVMAMLESLGSGMDVGALMGQLGVTDGRLPEQSAMIHRILNAASPAARERLLVSFVGELFA